MKKIALVLALTALMGCAKIDNLPFEFYTYNGTSSVHMNLAVVLVDIARAHDCLIESYGMTKLENGKYRYTFCVRGYHADAMKVYADFLTLPD